MDLGHVSPLAQCPPGDHGAGDGVGDDRGFRPVPGRRGAEPGDVGCQVAVEVGVVEVDEPAHVEPLVLVPHEHGEDGADLGTEERDPALARLARPRRVEVHPVGVHRPVGVHVRDELRVDLLAQQQHVVAQPAKRLRRPGRVHVRARPFEQPPVPQEDAHAARSGPGPQDRRKLGEVADHGVGTGRVVLGPELAGLDGTHAHGLGSPDVVVQTVADEDGLPGLGPDPLERLAEDPGSGLRTRTSLENTDASRNRAMPSRSRSSRMRWGRSDTFRRAPSGVRPIEAPPGSSAPRVRP